MVRNKFLELGLSKGYERLPEKSILDSESDSFFVMASVAAHMNLFQTGIHIQPSKFITSQRIFSAKRSKDVGKYPFATNFEIMLSLFRFLDQSTSPTLKFVHEFFDRYFNILPSQLIYLIPKELGMEDVLLSEGVEVNNIVSWETSMPLRLGKGGLEGYYVKIFLPYRHGVVPLATLGFIELDGGLAVDSALFLERLDMVKRGIPHWYDGPYFRPLTEALRVLSPFSELSSTKRFLWASHLRSIGALMQDGAVPSGKGPGHVLRRMIRELATTLVDYDIERDSIRPLIPATEECLDVINFDREVSEFSWSDVEELIYQSHRQIRREINLFTERLSKAPVLQKDIDMWKEERGLPFELLEEVAMRLNHDLPPQVEEKRLWIRNACYSFSELDKIEDPVEWLRNIEEERMKGVVPNKS